ncbi:MAG: hypothetical protein ACREJB_01165, partial [Planctomycetaceae bacterium]
MNSRPRRFALCAIFILLSSLLSADDRFPATLPDTRPLALDRPLHEVMVEGLNRFAERELAASRDRRAEKWHRDYSSHEAYAKSIAENRDRFRTIIGAVDERVRTPRTLVLSDPLPFPWDSKHPLIQFAIATPVSWDVLDGVTAEGWELDLKDLRAPTAAWVILLPDAGQTPEMLAGLQEGLPSQSQLGRRLLDHDCHVLVPTLINRDDTYSGHPDIRDTNQPHREFLYRMAFEMGRHVIGYEVQKVLAAVDVFERRNEENQRDVPIAVIGIGEGGLIAFHAAAIDPRIDAAWVCGYFNERENVWQEPIYRNVWSLLTEFGDAEIAGMVAPRHLIIEACAAPEVDG